MYLSCSAGGIIYWVIKRKYELSYTDKVRLLNLPNTITYSYIAIAYIVVVLDAQRTFVISKLHTFFPSVLRKFSLNKC